MEDSRSCFFGCSRGIIKRGDEMITLTNATVQVLARKLAEKIKMDNHFQDDKILGIYGVARGGIPIAYIVSKYIPDSIVVDNPKIADVIVDDIIESGATKERYEEFGRPFYGLIDKSKDEEYNDWIQFPWEENDTNTPVIDNLDRVSQYLAMATEDEAEPVLNYMKEILER